MAKKIVIVGNYGAGNIGDEMILEGALEMMKNIFPEAEITVLGADPQEVERIHRVKSLFMFPAGVRSFSKSLFQSRLKKTKQALKECDVFVIGGGGLFASIKKRANIIWGIQALWAGIYKKPIFILGQSLENIGGIMQRKIISKVFNRAKLIVLRDYHSKVILQTIGVSKPIYIMPDAAFRTQIAKSPEERKKKVVFVLRESKNLTKSVLEELRKFEEWILNEKKYEVEFVAFHKSDENLHENTIVPETPEKALRLFAEAKFVVGMPLHSVIGAIKIQTPFLALEYAKKLEAFLKFAGLSELGIDFGKITSGEMKNRFESLEKNYSNVKENLKAFNKKAFEELKELEEMIKSHNVF